jgi:long-subunit acyl-CoA synthetase (AMP-forming)
MEVGTSPKRWVDLGNLKGSEAKREKLRAEQERKREERARKTKVTRLLYLKNNGVQKTERPYETPDELLAGLKEVTPEEKEDGVSLKLYVAEDLSRDVIEHLGAQLDIEPAFFREQIVDYVSAASTRVYSKG